MRGAIVLVVSGQPGDRHLLLTSVEATGARAASAENAHDALALMRCMVFDVLIADGDEGAWLIDTMRNDERTAGVRCVLATSASDDRADRPMAVDLLPRPFAPDDVARIVRRVVADVTRELS